MPEQKTKPTSVSVERFLDQVADEQVRDDCNALTAIMKKITTAEPKMWGPSIVGFGSYHYKYESGHEGDACLTGFSPRKQNITLYVMPGATQHAALLDRLGKFKAGKGCIYIKKLADIDETVLKDLIKQSVDSLRSKYSK
jgi:hypothetical protein